MQAYEKSIEGNLEPLQERQDAAPLPLITLICCVATIGGFLFGFDSGVINGTVTGLQQAFHSDTAGTGFNVASMLLGCAAGAFFAGRLADLWGRKTLLLIAAVLFVVSAWGSGIATGSVEFVFYRILGGLAVGAASVMSPAYISEIAPAALRGRLTTINQIAIIFGLFAAFVSNYWLAQAAGSAVNDWWLGYTAWRWMFWIEIVPAMLFFCTLLLIPESPRYLVLSRQTEKARAVLSKLYGKAAAAGKLESIRQSTVSNRRPRLSDLLESNGGGVGKVRKIVWVGIGLATFQQLVGINVVFYYGAVLWQAVGFSEADALLINIISGGVSIAACLITMTLIDRIGRKPLLLAGSIGMAVTLGLVAFAFAGATVDANGKLHLSQSMGLLALIAANVYVFFFNGSWGPAMWTLLGEMFPNQIRGSGLAVSGLSQWVANFGITMSFPIMLTGIGLAGAYGIYTLFALLSIVFVVYLVQETKGLELEEIRG
ncbi:sugar porter family MFS transporter [Microbulbifer thermotolerans]|uniref:sugar porter family MFS transporter n=1 Tax=Microbulbifer thermotolerans TaxID=252514 RepID=UPI00224B237E|nr:sugar porter family MFS transporter [Microbulbifer thermotolerans]MCX2781596.1 sugar porter family MFS transporter [Microbulbifer thermotolerans]